MLRDEEQREVGRRTGTAPHVQGRARHLGPGLDVMPLPGLADVVQERAEPQRVGVRDQLTASATDGSSPGSSSSRAAPASVASRCTSTEDRW